MVVVDKIVADKELRWGDDFNDPMHIDDGLNLRDPKLYDQEFATCQMYC